MTPTELALVINASANLIVAVAQLAGCGMRPNRPTPPAGSWTQRLRRLPADMHGVTPRSTSTGTNRKTRPTSRNR